MRAPASREFRKSEEGVLDRARRPGWPEASNAREAGEARSEVPVRSFQGVVGHRNALGANRLTSSRGDGDFDLAGVLEGALYLWEM